MLSSGSEKKRKRTKIDTTPEKQKLAISPGTDFPSSSVCCVGCRGGSFRKICPQKSSHEDATLTTWASYTNSEETSSGECQKSSSQTLANPRKRFREFRWIRQRKRRLLSSQETYGQTRCIRNLCEEESLSGKLKYDNHTNFYLPQGKVFFFRKLRN